MKRSKD